jgi:hypothetical protein
MFLLKITDTTDGKLKHVNMEEIISFHYDATDDETYIIMKNNTRFHIKGNHATELAKSIVSLTKGTITNIG